MRIAHVVPSYLPAVRYGGPIFSVHALCRELSARGHEVEVFTTNLDGAGVSAVPLDKPLSVDGVKVRYFFADVSRRLSWSPSMARALKRELPRLDAVHIHTIFLWPTWAAARIATRHGLPYVLSPRGMLVKDLIQRRSRLAKSVWIKLIERRNLERASAIHVTSEIETAELQRFNWHLPQVTAIPNGVDVLQPATAAEPSDDIKQVMAEQPLALFLGRISWKKGLDRLLHALARTTTARLAIVGPDDEHLVLKLAQLSEQLQIRDRVSFIPRVVRGSDKDHLFAAARVFVLPSYSENMGNVVLEAMQRGVPVITTPEVGAAEIVREAGSGLVVDGEPEALGSTIERLIKNRALAESMGAAGKRHVTEHYTWAQIAARMEQLYARIIGEGARRRRA
ncbi:MAG TPA: glycosyltransferase [Xanthobacteraceae bacterium]|jgi:glycosyltransferase involved in cell wall biosynthesis